VLLQTFFNSPLDLVWLLISVILQASIRFVLRLLPSARRPFQACSRGCFGGHLFFVQQAFDQIFLVLSATEIVLNEGHFFKLENARKLAGNQQFKAL